MSFLTDLFEGKTSNLGNDLSPSNIFSDFGSDFSNQPGWAKGLEIAVPAALAAFAAPEFLPELAGATGAADAGGVAADTGFDLSTIGPGVSATGGAIGSDAAAGGVALAGLAPPGADLTAATSLAGDAGTAAATGATGGVPLAGLTPPASSTPSFLSSLVTGATNSITKNPLGIALSAAGLGYDLLEGNKTDPNQQALQNEAPQLQAQGSALTASGQQLQTYLTSGSLPPALQAQVTQSVAAAKAQIVANAASNGQNTNPTQNSQLAQDLAAADTNGVIAAGQLEQQLFSSGTQLLQTGINETGLSEQIYETLVNIDKQNNQQVMTAIANMAAALGGGSKISIGGSGTGLTIG